MKIFFTGRKRICPCCKEHRFEEVGKYEICPICKWEDDPIQRKNPSFAGGANELSLDQARQDYLRRKKNEKH